MTLRPAVVPVRYGDLVKQRRYQFVLDAANVIRTMNATVMNQNASEQWPLMLKQDDGEYLFVTESECRNIRLACPECDSVLFEVSRDEDLTCFDCAWLGRKNEYEEIEEVE